MKIIVVDGPNNRGNEVFATSVYADADYSKLWRRAWDSPLHIIPIVVEGGSFTITAFEFGEVDYKFIQLMRDRFIPTTMLDTRAFYLVEV